MAVELIHFIPPRPLPPLPLSSRLSMSAVIDALFKTMKFYVLFKGSGARPPGMLGNVVSSSLLLPTCSGLGELCLGPAMDAVVAVVRSGTGIPFLHVLV